MIWRFDDFELDTATQELRRAGDVVPTEPQVFALLLLLVENAERVVGKDEIVEKVWDGRIVSDAAIASRIKSARQALGDDGRSQRYIRTLTKSGVRFVGKAKPEVAAAAVLPSIEPELSLTSEAVELRSRPSIAVLPFHGSGRPEDATLADALPAELITELSRLRWLFVIARGSSFRFRGEDPDCRLVGRALGVRYCLSGSIERSGSRLVVEVELASSADGGVVWAERFPGSIDDVHEFRTRIVAGVVAALEIRIPQQEAERSRLLAPENLDAWSAYHLGLQHMFRFNRRDNAAATAMFELAAKKEPGFARAYAGLSFTHFQDAFLNYSQRSDREVSAARAFAEKSVDLDPFDPFANFTMGRSLWLEADLDGSLGWLDRARTLSPNYAQAIYSRAWADTISGRGEDGQQHADLAMRLSPLDPLLYAMLGTRALSHVVRGETAQAAEWGEKAARSPGAHVHIAVIAALAQAAHGNAERASHWMRNAHDRMPGLGADEFFRSFPFPEGEPRRRIADALRKAGL